MVVCSQAFAAPAAFSWAPFSFLVHSRYVVFVLVAGRVSTVGFTPVYILMELVQVPWDGTYNDKHDVLEKKLMDSTLDEWLATGGETIDDDTRKFLERLLVVDQLRRPTLAHVKDDPFWGNM